MVRSLADRTFQLRSRGLPAAARPAAGLRVLARHPGGGALAER